MWPRKSDRGIADLILVQGVDPWVQTVNNHAYLCKPLNMGGLPQLALPRLA
jgi:hypothetical protein